MIVKDLKTWHKHVVERDGSICQLQLSPDCKKDYSFDYYLNEKGENPYLCGDHLKPRNVAPELKLETTNGKCVCLHCHSLRHKGMIPEGYLNQVEETTTYTGKEKSVTLSIAAFAAVILCKKCKKYSATSSGLCLQCEPFKGANFKKLKSNKK